ncbi:hypothetical protein I5E68_08810 [Novosphingobium sp. YJ-S2-02]|uniref:Uncharacterized protein n=1 Tax=Novosphingobium aureum TaxID=2792964 RepID=A0A931MKL3_9SPHN|nr:hypothetical protein [Novosphingobium aureum]MBH0113047.1 hypothetical protein [Novosphingobium aureum]
MTFIKAMVPSFLLTGVVSGVFGSQGARASALAIERIHLEGHTFYWSWSLFTAATGLAWLMLLMMDD